MECAIIEKAKSSFMISKLQATLDQILFTLMLTSCSVLALIGPSGVKAFGSKLSAFEEFDLVTLCNFRI